jgi:hypothetical protein
VGVSPTVAFALAEEFEPAHLSAYLEAFARNRAQGRRYTPGWLVNAIREGWQVRHLKPATIPRDEPPADPFERAWRRAVAMSDDEVERLRTRAVATASDDLREKLIDAEPQSGLLRSAIAELLSHEEPAGP